MGRLYRNNFYLLNLKKYIICLLQKKKKKRQNVNNYDMEDVTKFKC